MYAEINDKQRLTHYQRPDGRWYKARRPPAAYLVENYGEVDGVMVARCDDYEFAKLLAQRELNAYDDGYMPVAPRFGWYREGIRDNDRFWEEDPVKGAPGYFFTQIRPYK